MRKIDFLNKYLEKDIDVDNVIGAFDGFNGLRDTVSIKINNNIKELEICEVPQLLGFKSIYSVENQYPELAKKWSNLNNLNPSEVFYKSNKLVAVDTDDGIMTVNLIKSPESTLNDVEEIDRKSYNFKNLKWFKEKIKDIPINIFPTVLIGEYTKFVEYFLESMIDEESSDNIILRFSDFEFLEYFKSKDSKNYSKLSYLSATYNTMFKVLNLNLKVSMSNFNIDYNDTDFIKKDELLEYCELFNNPQTSFILYAVFMGLGDYHYEKLRSLKWEQIDSENKVIHYDDGDIPIDDEFIELARECNAITEYVENTNNGKSDGYRVFKLNPNSEYVLKPRKQSNNNDGLDMMASISIRFSLRSASDYIFGYNKLTKTYLHRSGILHRMNEIKKETGIRWTYHNILDEDNGLPFTFNLQDMIHSYRNVYERDKIKEEE